jgi:hypothetical protein
MGIEQFVAVDNSRVLGLAPVTPGELSVLRYRLPANGYLVRELRGSKMSTVSALFDEFAAALQFPYYFGENKDAFDECMRDLDEFVGIAAGYVLVIRDAEQVLSAEPDQRRWLYDVLRHFADDWAGRAVAVVFRVVLQGVPARVRQSVVGVDLPTLQLSE